ncbi:hypothetical protein F2P81_022825 [Scophthalmus maximus]|uniref:BZIP domain-containing protein n=1 Tax=Scophthalmus maximus TaxID=52904 RepID=A0A6A4S5X2_SCOMX|nr:hypothetical protein F2P81_022825 [Scophthalmus maximus]
MMPSGLPSSRTTPSPIDPDSIQVPVGYEPDPVDLALSSVPGQEMFDPRKCKFSAEELKPQPMIKKARKIFIPEDLKDDKYWARRRKNNVAAKRSRDARRLKENQIATRAGFLEKENSALRQEVVDLRKELGRTKNVLLKYEAQHRLLEKITSDKSFTFSSSLRRDRSSSPPPVDETSSSFLSDRQRCVRRRRRRRVSLSLMSASDEPSGLNTTLMTETYVKPTPHGQKGSTGEKQIHNTCS